MKILIADDEAEIRAEILECLAEEGHDCIEAGSGVEAVSLAFSEKPDLILLDVNMPGLSGIQACERIKAETSLSFTPVIMITALSDTSHIVSGLAAGADDYLTKPVSPDELIARVNSMLRIKTLHDQVLNQAKQLKLQAKKLSEWNRKLKTRVRSQVEELERIGTFERFLAPQLAEVIGKTGGEEMFKSHRQNVTVIFCDIRGFTKFSVESDPEEVMEVLREFHGAMERNIHKYQGTLASFAGDGLMVFFNDPFPQPEHPSIGVRMALSMQTEVRILIDLWSKRGNELGFGVGIATGFATMGLVGFQKRVEYTAIGNVTNLAARLCDRARNGEILVESRVRMNLDNSFNVSPAEMAELKGFPKSIQIYNVLDQTPPSPNPE